MPQLDPAALKALHRDAARARRTLDAADARLAGALAGVREAEAAAAAARAAGDRRAIRQAESLLSARRATLEAGRVERAELHGRLGELLEPLRQVELEAPGDVPLLLMPIRIETRFDGPRKLRVRIYPDTIHVDTLDRGLTPEEEAAGRAYWTALWQAPEGAADAAWPILVRAAGADRATWVARATTPVNLAAGGGAPEFAAVAAPRRGAAVGRLLPEVFHVTAVQQGQVTRGRGSRVAPELKIGLLADDGTGLVEKDGLKMLPGTEWLADYDAALAAGMAITLALPKASPVDRLFVYGVCRSRDAAEAAGGLEALLESHWCTAGLGFIPQGTPTNNTEEDRTGWQRRIEPRPIPLATPAPPPDANAAVTAAALGIGAPWLALLDHGQEREQGAARAMNGALWPATWGYFLETLDESSTALSPVVVDNAREFHARRVRGRGPLPALRIGNQPYGLLPVMPLAPASDAPAFERDLAEFLATILPDWKNGVPGLPRVGGAGNAADALLDIMGWSPVSYGVRARKCLSGNMVQVIGAATEAGAQAVAIEGMLAQLLQETLGRFSFAHAVGTLDAESRPLLLPYADPARDAGFLAELLASGRAGTISSIFQALVALGWDQASRAAKPPRGFEHVAEVAVDLDAGLLRDVVGSVARPLDTNPQVYGDLLARLPGADDAAARPSIRRVQPIGGADARYMDFAASATSEVERANFALLAVDEIVRMSNRLGILRAALQELAELGTQPGGADFTLLVAEALDTASHRLDAWITGLASARLDRLRARRATGLAIGAFGWLENLAPQARAPRPGGYVAAPSLAQATTAGLLRSAYLAHNPGAGGSSAFAIDLSSARVRLALSLIEGIRNGQPIGALLGYGFERRLHDIGADRFVLSFRGLAPLVEGALTDASDEGAQQTVAASNVTDMLKLIDRYRAAGGPDAVRAALARRPTGNEYLDPDVAWQGPGNALWAKIVAAIEESIGEADAVADLMLAESVHQLAQGNLRRASATLDAAGRGEGPPSEPDFVATATPGVVVTHRLVVVGPKAGAWSTVAPRAAAAPAVEAWLGTRLGAPKRVVLAVEGRNRRITLADAGLSACDFVLGSTDPAQLERMVRLRLGLAGPLVEAGDDRLRAGEVSLAMAVHAARALAAVLETARALDAFSLALPGRATWRPAAAQTQPRLATLEALLGQLATRIAALDALMAAPAVDRDSLVRAMLDLAEFGIVVPDLGDPPRSELVFLALDEARARHARATALWTGADKTQELVEQFGEALFGRGFVLPMPLAFQPADPAEATGERAVSPVAPGEIERFMADAGSVRAATGAFNKAALLCGIVGNAPQLALTQLCGIGERATDHWIGAGLPPDEPTPTAPVVSILADAPGGLDLSDVVEGLILDDWTETMATRSRHGEDDAGPSDVRVTAGVALHADAPNAQPPQALLLALSPTGRPWNEDALVGLLGETLDLAGTRLITLDSLPLAGRILPAIYTRSWSLQGEPRIDWSKVSVSLSELNAAAHLRNFTLTKEP